MKLLLMATLLIITMPTKAAENCYQFEVQGSVKSTQDQLVFILAPETQSELKLKIPVSVQSKFFPFVNNWVKTEIVLNTESINHHSKINNVISIKRAVPDPLNAGGSMHKFVGARKCL